MKRIGWVLVLIIGFHTSALAQECTEGTSIYPELIATNWAESCCSKNKPNKCLKKKYKNAITDLKVALGGTDFTSIMRPIFTALKASCDLNSVDIPACTDDNSLTTADIVENLENSKHCTAKLKSSRQSKLKKAKRNVNQVKAVFGNDFVTALKADIKSLLNANSCGQGGEESAAGCGRIKNPRDGADGNVYKQADHSCATVFVSHDGSRSGSAITTSGQLLERLRYTGLGNRDARGLRHHYRMSRCCSGLPNTFYLKLGGTCYIIDKKCGRVD